MRIIRVLALIPVLNAFASAQDAPPWRTNHVAARAEAREEGKPCVLLLNVDARAL